MSDGGARLPPVMKGDSNTHPTGPTYEMGSHRFTAVSALVIAGALLGISQFNLSALPEPGNTETSLATRVRHLLVHRAAARQFPRHQESAGKH